MAASYSITIEGVDRTNDIINGTIRIDDIVNEQANTLGFSIRDLNGLGVPSIGDEIIIEVDTYRIFGGNVVSINSSKNDGGGMLVHKINCTDFTALLDQNLAIRSYQSELDGDIIRDVVTRFAGGTGITTLNVTDGATIDQISFNYVQPSQAFRKITELTGRSWYIDYFKDVHYFLPTTNPAPFNLTTATENKFRDLQINKDSNQIKNRVYVRGGKTLSDPFTYSTTGDGEKRVFILPDKPREITFLINGVPQTVGIKNIDDPGTFDSFLNFQEKYVELDAAVATPSSTDVLSFTYKFDIPILVAVQDDASIAEFGQREFAIFDNTIATLDAARDRATAELTDYADALVEASFSTYENGFFSGQSVVINLPEYGVNEEYYIQRIAATSLGGGVFNYQVSLASAKSIGIIRFLIKLLEDDRNLIELNDDEVVDELLNISDSVSPITDAITLISKTGSYKWALDGGDPSPDKGVWELSQWAPG